jgi:hypothetical protein
MDNLQIWTKVTIKDPGAGGGDRGESQLEQNMLFIGFVG